LKSTGRVSHGDAGARGSTNVQLGAIPFYFPRDESVQTMIAAPTPPKYATVTSVFNVKGADAFITFCQGALGAEFISRRPTPDGAVMHADLRFGDFIVMVSDAIRDAPATCLTALFSDADAVFNAAVRAGATATMAPTDTPWGQRWARVVDAWGNRRTFTTQH